MDSSARVGNTPLIRLARCPVRDRAVRFSAGGVHEPGGSVRTRRARHRPGRRNRAERCTKGDGRRRHRGNTGIGLAHVLQCSRLSLRHRACRTTSLLRIPVAEPYWERRCTGAHFGFPYSNPNQYRKWPQRLGCVAAECDLGEPFDNTINRQPTSRPRDRN